MNQELKKRVDECLKKIRDEVDSLSQEKESDFKSFRYICLAIEEVLIEFERKFQESEKYKELIQKRIDLKMQEEKLNLLKQLAEKKKHIQLNKELVEGKIDQQTFANKMNEKESTSDQTIN